MFKKLYYALTGKVRKFLSKCVYEGLLTGAQDIQMERQRRAMLATLEYVESKMSDVKAVRSRFGVLDMAIERANIVGNKIICEFGVWEGASINHMAKQVPETTRIYGFDSFEGLPEFWRDQFETGMFAVKRLPVTAANVKLVKGWFEQSIPLFLQNNKIEEIALLHVDCDLYSSAKVVLDDFEKYIKKGTVLVFDEYFNYPGWEQGEFKAFQEFIERTGLKYKYLYYNSAHEQVAVIID